MKWPLIAILAFVVFGTSASVQAADNPVLRKLLSSTLKNELSKHNSEDTAWYNADSKKKVKWAKTKVFGKVIKTKVAEWKEESKSWVWLDNPKKNLSVDVYKFELKNDVLKFGVKVKGKVKGKVWGKIPNVVTADVKTSAVATITIEGTVKITKDKLSEANITKASGSLSDLRFNNDALKVMQGDLNGLANRNLKDNEGKFKKDLAKALNGVKFP